MDDIEKLKIWKYVNYGIVINTYLIVTSMVEVSKLVLLLSL